LLFILYIIPINLFHSLFLQNKKSPFAGDLRVLLIRKRNIHIEKQEKGIVKVL